MKRGRSTGKPTVAQQQRMDAITEIGCIVAHSLGIDLGDRPIPAEVHHLTVGGKHGAKRRGHDFTIGLNPWSHRGEPFGGMSAARCEELFGPSYARVHARIGRSTAAFPCRRCGTSSANCVRRSG
nr:Ref family recombination enhancement nuclease [Stenotrophomonas geniculata]